MAARIGWFEVNGANLQIVRLMAGGSEVPAGTSVAAGNFGGAQGFVPDASVEYKLIVPKNGPDEIVIIEKASGTVAILKYRKGAKPTQ